MKRIPVTSSQIAAIGYDPVNKQADIEFTRHKPDAPASVYRYYNVEQSDMNALLGAESIGSHFIKTIKKDPDRFPFKKLTAEEAAK